MDELKAFDSILLVACIIAFFAHPYVSMMMTSHSWSKMQLRQSPMSVERKRAIAAEIAELTRNL